MAGEELHRKKEGLKLAQLATYDDIITDALVDRVYFWTKIRKNRARYSSSRRIREEEIADILRQTVIVDKDPVAAAEELLCLPAIMKQVERLSSPEEKEHFHRHLRKYVNIYMPDCPFEVSTTNRYTIDTHEACVTARRDVRKGELVKYLNGIVAPITPDEEKSLDLTRSDFSIVVSSRKRIPSLFLGPARFANHDCDANARLTPTGSNGMTIVAIKHIEVGDEITVTYGADYFGINNCECLCSTCEQAHRNGWAGPITNTIHDQAGSAEAESQADSIRSHSKRAFASVLQSSCTTPESTRFNKHNWDTLSHDGSTSGLRSSPQSEGHKRAKIRHVPSVLSQELLQMATFPSVHPLPGLPPTCPSIDGDKNRKGEELDEFDSTNNQHSGHNTLSEYMQLRDVTPEMIATPLSMPANAISKDQDLCNTSPPTRTFETFEAKDVPCSVLGSSAIIDGLLTPKISSSPAIQSSHVTTMSNDTEPPSPKRLQAPDNLQLDVISDSIEQSQAAGTDSGADVSDHRQPVRTPGDYTLTPALLSHPYSRWVTCRSCFSDFIQENAYQTRWACPRCERHSKLYGYEWPKTDQEGRNDTEERVLDHREIHRFVYSNEERLITKGKNKSLKTLLAERLGRSEASTSDAESASRNQQCRLRRRFTRPVGDVVYDFEEAPAKKRRVETKSDSHLDKNFKKKAKVELVQQGRGPKPYPHTQMKRQYTKKADEKRATSSAFKKKSILRQSTPSLLTGEIRPRRGRPPGSRNKKPKVELAPRQKRPYIKRHPKWGLNATVIRNASGVLKPIHHFKHQKKAAPGPPKPKWFGARETTAEEAKHLKNDASPRKPTWYYEAPVPLPPSPNTLLSHAEKKASGDKTAKEAKVAKKRGKAKEVKKARKAEKAKEAETAMKAKLQKSKKAEKPPRIKPSWVYSNAPAPRADEIAASPRLASPSSSPLETRKRSYVNSSSPVRFSRSVTEQSPLSEMRRGHHSSSKSPVKLKRPTKPITRASSPADSATSLPDAHLNLYGDKELLSPKLSFASPRIVHRNFSTGCSDPSSLSVGHSTTTKLLQSLSSAEKKPVEQKVQLHSWEHETNLLRPLELERCIKHVDLEHL